MTVWEVLSGPVAIGCFILMLMLLGNAHTPFAPRVILASVFAVFMHISIMRILQDLWAEVNRLIGGFPLPLGLIIGVLALFAALWVLFNGTSRPRF